MKPSQLFLQLRAKEETLVESPVWNFNTWSFRNVFSSYSSLVGSTRQPTSLHEAVCCNKVQPHRADSFHGAALSSDLGVETERNRRRHLDIDQAVYRVRAACLDLSGTFKNNYEISILCLLSWDPGLMEAADMLTRMFNKLDFLWHITLILHWELSFYKEKNVPKHKEVLWFSSLFKYS